MHAPKTARFTVTRRDLTYLHLLAWAIFALVFVGAVQQLFHENQERDFVFFYSDGRILNERPPADLYEYSVQKKVFQEVLPLHKGEWGPSPYPPFVALFFRPFARLSYWTGCRVWMGITLVLYIGGISLLNKRFLGGDRLGQSLVFCFALSYWPFLYWTLLNSQLSAVGFFAMAVAIYLENVNLTYLSGLALSICLYKPTLLILVLPMLLITRRFKTFAGFSLGAITLTAFTIWAVGPSVWQGYFRMSAEFARTRQHIFLCNYVDIQAFSLMIAHGITSLRVVVLWLGIIPAVYLLRLWWLVRRSVPHITTNWVWATTITWTLLLNFYVPYYDSILIVISIIITARSFSSFGRFVFLNICCCVLLFSHLTRQIALGTGWQMLTLIFAALGTLQLVVSRADLMLLTAKPKAFQSAVARGSNRTLLSAQQDN